jgi:hypothetical protein
MRLIDADAMLLRVDLIGTNKFGMLDEDIREFISEQPTVDIEPMLPFDWSKVPVDTPILVRDKKMMNGFVDILQNLNTALFMHGMTGKHHGVH